MILEKQRMHGSTVVECLVALVMFALLFAVLWSTKPKRPAHVIQCIQNQGEIWKGYTAWANDHGGKFPRVIGIGAVGGQLGSGKLGDELLPEEVLEVYGAFVPVDQRPLNRYVQSVTRFHCPADTAGGSHAVASCWETMGNSYQPQVADDLFGVRRVLGLDSEPESKYEGRSITLNEIGESPRNKIIQGDWNWPASGPLLWHGGKVGGHVMLFGDGHADVLKFPSQQILTNQFLHKVPDLKSRWW